MGGGLVRRRLLSPPSKTILNRFSGVLATRACKIDNNTDIKKSPVVFYRQLCDIIFLMNLFTELEKQNKQVPLAELLRPKTLEEFLGQSNVIAKNSPLMNLIKSQRLFSLILWGTPG